jgi:hypothetical protein
MYIEVSNGTGVSSVLSSDIEVVAKRREIMIYVKQPTMYFYIPDRGLLPDYGVWRRRRLEAAVGGGGGWWRPSGSKRQVLPPVLQLGEQRHHLKFYLLSRTVRMEATGKFQQQDGLTRSTRPPLLYMRY